MTDNHPSVKVFSKNNWLLQAVLWPFVVTRALLVLAGWLIQFFLPFSFNPDPMIETRGWLFSSHRIIDMWARWDAGWYLGIAKEGYRMVENVYTTSNLAFFPVYPYLVKILTWLVPAGARTDELIITIGVLLSNVLLLGSLVLLYQLTHHLFENKKVAQRAIWYLLVFPTSFFLSSFYTESVFLFFSLASLWAAKKQRWGWACGLAAITGATRSIGLLIVLPLLWEYLASKKWQLRKIDYSILWFAVTPLGVVLFFTYLYYLTGDFFAALKVQNAWGRRFTDPLTSFLFPTGLRPYITRLDQLAILTTVVTGLAMLRDKLKELLPLGIYSILLILPTLFTSTLDSAARFMMVIFPIFIYWAYVVKKLGKDKRSLVDLSLKVTMMIVQLILFARYSQFYWAG